MASVREAHFEDHAGIAALEERHGLFTTPEADWRRRWQENPAISGAQEPWPIGWVIETEAKDIAGFFGNIPMAYEINGEPVLAAATNSWVVDEDFRGQALELLSRFLAQPNVDIFLSTTANAATTAAMTAFKTRKVPQPDCDKSLFWITNPFGFGRALTVKAGFPLAGIFGPITGLGVVLANAFHGGRPSETPPEGCRLATTNSFDDRFDGLWQRIRGQTGKLRFVRDRENISWHFNRFLTNGQAWVVTCEKGGSLNGYAVFVRQDNAAIGLRRAILADYQADGDDADVLRSLLLAGLGECRERDLYMLEAPGFSPTKRDLLNQLKPWTRKLPIWPYLYKARNAGLAKRLEDPACWDACPIDGDASL